MRNGSLTKYFQDMDRFVRSMKEKCRIRMSRHYNDKEYSIEGIQQHLVEEILETFILTPKEHKCVSNILNNSDVVKNELKDIAIMSWALEMTINEIDENELDDISDEEYYNITHKQISKNIHNANNPDCNCELCQIAGKESIR